MTSQLVSEEYHPFYGTYINKIKTPNILDGLISGKKEFIEFVQEIPDEKLKYAYAEGKWTLAEVIQHIIDTERIFAYRALRIARNDKSSLLGFDQDIFVPYSNANNCDKEHFVGDYENTRNSSIFLFKSFTGEMLTRIGVVGDGPMSTRVAGYILSGHQNHHVEIIKERYL